jgi:transcriptional regulator with XRE-family HTH domain
LKTLERKRARQLREDGGYSIKQIAGILGVSRSSVSVWVRDIALTSEQHEALRQRNPIYNAQLAGRGTTSARRRAERSEYQKHGRALARRGDATHAAGCMLFWAEGTRNQNSVRFSNSDPEMVPFRRRRVLEVQRAKAREHAPLWHCRVVVNRTSVVQSIYGAIQSTPASRDRPGSAEPRFYRS